MAASASMSRDVLARKETHKANWRFNNVRRAADRVCDSALDAYGYVVYCLYSVAIVAINADSDIECLRHGPAVLCTY